MIPGGVPPVVVAGAPPTSFCQSFGACFGTPPSSSDLPTPGPIPSALSVIHVALPKAFTEPLGLPCQLFFDCAEKVFLRFIQIALLDATSHAEPRRVSSARAATLGAVPEVVAYFKAHLLALSAVSYRSFEGKVAREE